MGKSTQAVSAPAPADTAAAPAPAGAGRATIRMYRQGLGDCFLVTLNLGPQPYRILIDCGVILGTPNAATTMTKVAQDILDTTGGTIDLLVGTHEHWDHLSGFLQARAVFDRITFKEVWLGWTEDPDSADAQKLGATRAAAVSALTIAEAHLRQSDTPSALQAADETRDMLDFFGPGPRAAPDGNGGGDGPGLAAAGGTTSDALEYVRGRTPKPRYARPTDPPATPIPGVRIFTLGPPLDPKFLKQSDPAAGQAYGIDAVDIFLDTFGADLAKGDRPPFAASHVIPIEIARHQPFFAERYFARDQARRNIDTTWLEPASDLALKLDSDTNNTSLVLAIELEGKDVLLFAADAQIGNWLSWATLSWPLDGATVTGPDLLRRTIVYKVGHHGSHNATLKPGGLDIMDALKYALIPVDAAMALKKRWGRMPLTELVDELTKRTQGAILRIDQPAPTGVSSAVLATDLYYELTV